MFSIVDKPFIFFKTFDILLKLIVGILKVTNFLAHTVDSVPHFIVIGLHVDEISMFSIPSAPSFSNLHSCDAVIEHLLLFLQTAHGYFGVYPCHL